MKVLNILMCFVISFGMSNDAFAQPDRWQQKAKYKMKIDFDVNTHKFTGEQELKYWNNSPDTLTKVFYHLYFNAFQPGSMMDVRSLTIADPDRRVGDRISKLGTDEVGYHRIEELKQDGKITSYRIEGTILEVNLAKPIYPGKSTTLKMKFNSQVPLQIRRSGRNNAEGIDYSMAQWYPKLAEYDYQGWHANPYIGREFYGIWGDFEVEIKINGNYTLGASGVLQNADKIGRGYSDKEGKKRSNKSVTWKWKAENVHDFVWAADRDYVVESRMAKAGTKMYFIYQPGEKTNENWQRLPKVMDEALTFMNAQYGRYPYPVYSFIQGGDGGMEYPMATLITGERSMNSLVGVSVHEWMHSWYQMVLGTNEALYAWMDEGFTSFGTSETTNHLRRQKLISGTPVEDPHVQSVKGILNFHSSGRSEPLSIHADHFVTNGAYGRGAYTKGQVALVQLRYIMGDQAFRKGMLRYYNTWKFKHPNANDFIRVMEKTSGLELDWFKEYFVNTTFYPDYGVESVVADDEQTIITLAKLSQMPMPLDVVVTYEDDTKSMINIPIRMMRGEKPNEHKNMHFIQAEDWPWTHPEYKIVLEYPLTQIRSIEIDPSQNMLDLDRSNNKWEKSE